MRRRVESRWLRGETYTLFLGIHTPPVCLTPCLLFFCSPVKSAAQGMQLEFSMLAESRRRLGTWDRACLWEGDREKQHLFSSHSLPLPHLQPPCLSARPNYLIHLHVTPFPTCSPCPACLPCLPSRESFYFWGYMYKAGNRAQREFFFLFICSVSCHACSEPASLQHVMSAPPPESSPPQQEPGAWPFSQRREREPSFLPCHLSSPPSTAMPNVKMSHASEK